MYNDFNDSCVELVFITHWCCATFEVGYIAFIIGNNKCTFKLPCSLCIDTEIR